MANKIYRAIETAKTFQDSGGDYTLSLASLGANSGRSSVLVDRGVGSVPIRYRWRAIITWATTGIVWETAEIYVSESDGSVNDSTWTANAAVTENSFENANYLGAVYCQMTTPATASITSGIVILSARYYMVGVWNRSTTKTLNATANLSKVIFTAMPDEIQ
jgi:hypothetical protein